MPRPPVRDAELAGRVRIGYGGASTVRQSLDTQLDSLRAAGITRIFSEKISTRATTRPELDKAVHLAQEIRASGAAVTLVVHEHKRLGRGLELAALAEQLKASGIGLEFLTDELQGSHDPSGVVFTVLAALSGMEREYIRDRTLEGQESARARGKSIGGAGVTDDHMLSMALHLRSQELSLRDIASRLVITKGKKTGTTPVTRDGPAPAPRARRSHHRGVSHRLIGPDGPISTCDRSRTIACHEFFARTMITQRSLFHDHPGSHRRGRPVNRQAQQTRMLSCRAVSAVGRLPHGRGAAPVEYRSPSGRDGWSGGRLRCPGRAGAAREGRAGSRRRRRRWP